MAGATLRVIRRLFGLPRPRFRDRVVRVAAECFNMSDAEILSLATKAQAAGDAARAAPLLSVAAERGVVEAQFRLGEMFTKGDVPTERFPQGELSYRMQVAGVRWLTAAAQAGHSEAAARLASIVLIDADTTQREGAPARSELEER